MSDSRTKCLCLCFTRRLKVFHNRESPGLSKVTIIMGLLFSNEVTICITGVSSGGCTKLLWKMFLASSYVWLSSVFNINLEKLNVPCSCNTDI